MGAIAALTTQQVTWTDTGLYHYSLTQWLAQYGTVPGIALLFENLGFTSSWFALAAPLNPESLESRVSAVTNGFVYWLALCQVWTGIRQISKGKAKLSDWFMSGFFSLILLVTLGVPGMRQLYVSPTSDLPVMMLVGVVAWVILRFDPFLAQSPFNFQFDSQHSAPPIQSRLMVIPLVLALGTVAIKLTALPLLGIAGLFLVLRRPLSIQHFWSRFLSLVGLTSLLLSPFLVSSIVTSGCPLYPSSLFCLDLPWSPAQDVLQSVGDSTHGWISWYGQPPADAHPWLWALGKWWETERANQIMGVSILVSIVIAPYPLRVARQRRSPALLWLVALATVGIGFIMLKAPFTRFALPYILLVPTLAIALLGQYWITPRLTKVGKSWAAWSRSKRGRSVVQASALGFLVLLLVRQASGGTLLLPPEMPKVAIEQQQVNDVTYNSPQNEGDLCWATPIPCAFEVPAGVRLRNPAGGIGDGFVRQR